MDHQARLHASLARFLLVVGGRRVGKSKSCLNEVIRHSFSADNRLSWWISPTYSEAREVGFEEFLALEEAISPAIRSLHKGNMKVEFVNGSKLYFKGGDRKDSLRGRGLTMAVLDEAAFHKRDNWYKVIRPALADRRGKGLLATTPNGRGNWIYQLYLDILSGKAGWESFVWQSMLNPLIDEAEMEAMRSDMSDMEFRQEVLAEFVTRSGQVYEDFGEENKIDVFRLDPKIHQIYIAADFGYANAAAIGFFAVNEQLDTVTQFDELYGAKMTIHAIESRILEKLARHSLSKGNVTSVYTDPAGNAEELTSGLSPVDYLRKHFTVINKGTKIAPGLALVRSYIKNALGQRRFFVTRNCVESIRSLEGYIYPPSTGDSELIKEEPLKDGIHDHACDMIRYFFVNRFDHAKWVTDRLNIDSYTKSTEKAGGILKRCSVCRKVFVSRTPKGQPPFECIRCESKVAAQ